MGNIAPWDESEDGIYERRTTPAELPEGYVLDGLSPLPGESREAFDSYVVYRDLGVGRTLNETARTLGKNAPMLVVRSHRNRWRERVALFDRMLAEDEHEAIRRSMEKHVEKMISRRMEIQETEYQNYLKIQQKTDVMLTWPTFLQEVSRDGKTIKYIPYKWSATSLAQLLEQASILARRSTEMPTSYQQLDINANTSQEISTAHMTPEEKARHEYAQRIAAEAYLAVMEAPEVPELTAHVVTADPEPPSWYKPEGKVQTPEIPPEE